MNYDKLFTKLNSETSSETYENILSFLRHSHRELLQNPDQTPKIAYAITGLLATDYIRNLDEADPLNEIFTIAGELEAEPENIKLKNELLVAIDQLK